MAATKKASKKVTKQKKVAKKPTKRAATKKVALKRPAPSLATAETPVETDCKCKQKKPNGNFFCFRLVQGRWVQASGIGFPTKEVCEAALCGE